MNRETRYKYVLFKNETILSGFLNYTLREYVTKKIIKLKFFMDTSQGHATNIILNFFSWCTVRFKICVLIRAWASFSFKKKTKKNWAHVISDTAPNCLPQPRLAPWLCIISSFWRVRSNLVVWWMLWLIDSFLSQLRELVHSTMQGVRSAVMLIYGFPGRRIYYHHSTFPCTQASSNSLAVAQKKILLFIMFVVRPSKTSRLRSRNNICKRN